MSDNAYVVFKTATTLDLRALTTFGLNAKPNTKSPIGYFGTGLKMAIAVLLREKVPVRLFIGETEYEFGIKHEDFRGTDYDQVGMKKRKGLLAKWSYVELPFTLSLAKNWTLWQAFRELESNTRDENGETTLQFMLDEGTIQTDSRHTTIIVGPSVEFAKVYGDRDKIFLPQALKEWDYTDDTIQVFKEPSKHVYYRGIRIMDLDKVSMFTYNIMATIELTEDRTAKYEWAVKSKIQAWLAKQEDRPLINQLLDATDDHFESKLDWDDMFAATPSAVFKDILAHKVAKANGKEAIIHPRFSSYHSYVSPPPPPPRTERLWHKLEEWTNLKAPDLSEVEIELLKECIAAMKDGDI